MIFISHRGNILGPIPKKENHPDYILNALKKYYVEVDVWLLNNKLYLGHDEPLYDIYDDILYNDKVLFHAKNYDAVVKLSHLNLHYYWHQEDDYTLTSQGLIWVYPGKKYCENSIVVMPELFTSDLKLNCKGICSDYIEKYI